MTTVKEEAVKQGLEEKYHNLGETLTQKRKKYIELKQEELESGVKHSEALEVLSSELNIIKAEILEVHADLQKQTLKR